MSDTYLVLTISIVAGVIQAIFWRWVATLSSNQDENRQQLNNVKTEIGELRAEIYRNYPTKSETHKDNDRIMQSLYEIKAELSKVNDKLDKKADK